MTADEIDRLTIAEVRAIADRAHEALARLREVQSLLGGAAANQPTTEAPSVAVVPPARRRPELTPAEQAQRDALLAQNRADGRPALTAHEIAQREALLAQNRNDALPPEIKAMEGIS